MTLKRPDKHSKNSIWVQTMKIPAFPQLDHDARTEVLIIGGGIAGILCAYMLEKAGVDYMLVEADQICHGITKNTTAKITVQHGLIYQNIIRDYGEERAEFYYRANQEALDTYRKLCKTIDCDFEEKNSCVYTLNDPAQIELELAALEKWHVSAEYVTDTELPFSIAGGIQMRNQAQFHPLKFLAAIAGKLHIYEHTMVKKLHGRTVFTETGTITANKIIVTTHFPFLNRHGSYFLKMYQHRSYVIAYENAQSIKGMYVDESGYGMSFRSFENLLLLGGGAHRTGKEGGNWEKIRRFALQHYPEANERAVWSTQDCMTLDSIPYIGNYSRFTPHLYVATGFNKWGMTSSMTAALLLRDLVLERENPYASVFSPSRNMLKKQLAINMVEATANLLVPRVPRCPHLGCALKWNQTEHSWDCPCHGSTFDESGTLVHNPAMKSLKRSVGQKNSEKKKNE